MFDQEKRAEKRRLKEIAKAERKRLREEKQEAYVHELQAKREADAALERKETDQFGKEVCQGAFALKTVRIYSRGYVKIAPVMLGKNARYERLLSIEYSGDVQKKTGPGRVGAAVVTGGANLLLTPNKRGDVYLTITTDQKTHVLREDPPNAMSIRSARQLAAAGANVIAQMANEGPENSMVVRAPSTTEAARSVTERLDELMKLHKNGMISETEYQGLRTKLLGEI